MQWIRWENNLLNWFLLWFGCGQLLIGLNIFVALCHAEGTYISFYYFFFYLLVLQLCSHDKSTISTLHLSDCQFIDKMERKIRILLVPFRGMKVKRNWNWPFKYHRRRVKKKNAMREMLRIWKCWTKEWRAKRLI